MRWPWVSRALLTVAESERDDWRVIANDRVDRRAFDLVVEERNHLRDQVQKLTDTITRIQRREVGLPEAPRSERPQRKPMPERLRKYIRAYGNKELQDSMTKQGYREHAQGKSWEDIERDTIPEGWEPNG